MTSESQKEKTIAGMVEKMKGMDMSSLAIMKTATTILEAKERLDREERGTRSA